jgi:CMP-N,N'-diacetyllegionaminic acid synthase
VGAARALALSMRTLGVVPARGGSRRVERKNLSVVGGRTLVRRALDAAAASGRLDAIALSSDDPAILAEAEGVDGVVKVERPLELATDTARTYDVVVHTLEVLERDRPERFEAVAIVQCTAPFTAPEDIAGAVDMLERTGSGSVVSVARVEGAHHPMKLKRMEGDRLVPFLEDDRMAPSHELPELWARNGAVYVTRRETIDAGSLVSDDVLGFRMPPERSHDIDTPLDLEFAEFLVSRGLAR